MTSDTLSLLLCFQMEDEEGTNGDALSVEVL